MSDFGGESGRGPDLRLRCSLTVHCAKRAEMMSHALPVYFHGVPGGPAELDLFGPDVSARSGKFFVARRDFPKQPPNIDRFALIADAVRQKCPDQPLQLIGFSLGSVAALRVAPLLGDQVEGIVLISPAAPLDLGEYLGEMAGAPVFRCAKNYPFAFNALSKGQSWLAKASPFTLYSALFSSAQGADIDLRDDPHFKSLMAHQLTKCLVSSLDTYRSEIRSYVGDWSQLLSEVSQPVSIFHGRSDNWSPVEMASDLAKTLPNCQSLEIMDGLSHYSTLKACLKKS